MPLNVAIQEQTLGSEFIWQVPNGELQSASDRHISAKKRTIFKNFKFYTF